MSLRNINIKYDSQKIYSEIVDLNFRPLQHFDGKSMRTASNWILAPVPTNSYTSEYCNFFVEAFETKLLAPPMVVRFKPPQINERHIDEYGARGVINIVIEDGFKVEIEDSQHDFRTGIIDIKKMHRLVDIHSTLHIVRMSVEAMYSDLLATGIRKKLFNE